MLQRLQGRPGNVKQKLRSLHRAGQRDGERGVFHLIVVDAASGYPASVLSTLDLAAAYATA